MTSANTLFTLRSKEDGQTLSSGWHRIGLPGASKYPKETVLQALANALSLRSLTLEPIAFKLQGPHYAFHVIVFVTNVIYQSPGFLFVSLTTKFFKRFKVLQSNDESTTFRAGISDSKLNTSCRLN